MLLERLMLAALCMAASFGWVDWTLAQENAQNATEGTAQANKPVVQIPLREGLQTVIVDVEINETYTATCILDTGMPEGVFLFDPATGKKCGLQYVGQANVKGGGEGTLTADIAMDENLALETLKWPNQRVIVLSEPNMMAHLGVDGAIGATVFSNYVVQLDFDRKLVSLYLPNDFDSTGLGEPIPIEIENTKASIGAVITLDGKETSVNLLLDTGASKGLSLNPSATSAFQPPEPVLNTYLGAGVGGSIKGSIGRISSLRIGNHVLENVATSFPDRVGVDKEGTIGMAILNRFLVTIDYPNRRVFLVPNKRFDHPTEFSMTGFSVLPDESGKLLVNSVMENSPASEADIQVGDQIIEINGKSIDFLEFNRLVQQDATPGTSIDFTFVRDDQKQTKKLELRRLR
jgi:hypothetical protein